MAKAPTLPKGYALIAYFNLLFARQRIEIVITFGIHLLLMALMNFGLSVSKGNVHLCLKLSSLLIKAVADQKEL